ncbi:MAG TPA: amino acid adenylation domain-containing protein, partial [Longimicrobiaceae bacterium]
VLGVERVGVGENFFDLGGHSLLATRVVARAQAALGVELTLRTLFEAPTVAGLAEHAEAALREGAVQVPPIVPTPRDGSPLPVSFAQARLWFIDQLEPGSAAYNIPVLLRVRGTVDARALAAALSELARRHESLRTVFAAVDGEPAQVVLPAAPVALPAVDLGALPEAARAAETRRLATEDAWRPFDLARGPLLRAALVQSGEGEHALLVCMHHVVSDGWSMGIFFRELSAVYEAFAEGRPSPLPELPVQYADFAVWQREWLSGEALEAQVDFWKDRLRGAPPLLEIPTDRPRIPGQSARGGAHPFTLSAEATRGLRALSRREGATLFMAVLTAWQALLGRYAGQEDVVVGSPIAGRTRAELEGVIGFFVNMLALRSDLGGEPTWAELLGRTRRAALGAYTHQDVPFERLVDELAPERSLTHAPLFQVTFALDRSEGEGLRLGDVGLEWFGEGEATAKLDLDLSLVDDGEALAGGLTFSAALFEPATVARMARHLETLLETMAADPERPLAATSLLREGERAQLLAAGRGEARPFPGDALVHQVIAARAAAWPDAPAVACGGSALSFRELHERADRLSLRLRARGVGPEARVAVFLDRSAELAVSLLAVLRAGGAFVPLDPGYPAGRLAYLLEDSGAAVVLTRAELAGALPAGSPPVVCVDAGEEPAGGADALDVGPDALAYLVYTSGSTGQPKGAMVGHRPLLCYAEAMRERMELGVGDRVLQFASPAFDVMIEEVFPAWLSGACVVFPRGDLLGSPHELLRLLERERVSVVELPTAFWHEWVRVVAEEGARLPESLRLVLVGGERVLAERLEQWAALGVPLLHVFGLTETTVTTTTLRLEAGDDGSRWSNLPVGVPLANAAVYVLDRAGEPVPAGVPGELYVGGGAVARGYHARPALTAGRYVPDPFPAEAGARLYRTGDRVRLLADGTLEFLGRIDSQVKLRGYRIEPGEVEAALCEHPAVREAVVVVREDAPGDRRLVGYVVAEGAAVSPAELRAHLGGRLPEHMVPGGFVVLDRLPLTSNGKVDRRALPAPEHAADAERYVAPRTPAEEVLAGIWGEVLGVERVGVEDGFFELGGHSLLATRVVSRTREVLAVELPLRALFEAPTVAGLAERVEALRRAEQPALPPVVPVGRAGAVPLSFAQERLWFIDQLEPGSAFYNVPAALRLSGGLDARALAMALGEIVRRHEALRTTFAEAEGSPVQIVAPFGGFALPVEDLSGLGESARAATVKRRAAEDAARPFDLRRGPLFRAALLRLEAEEHVLLLCMHHVVSDEWSMGVLFGELAALYAAYREGGESPLPELAVQYADYAVWQREQLQGEVLERQLGYWKERLAGAPELLELPADHPRPAVQTFRGAAEPVALHGELLERLEALSRREGATLYMTLLGAFQVLLSRYAGSEDVVVGSPIAGRTRRETEGLIGFFVNTLVLRSDLSGDPSFREVLRRVRETTLGAYEHQEVPFERLVAELRPERSLSHSPLFQVMFTLQNGAAEGTLPGLRLQPVEAELGSAKFDLTLGLAATPQGLLGELSYATDLFERETIARMRGHLERVLEQVAQDVDARLSGLELLGEAERAQVLDAWSRSADEPPPLGRCVHESFAEQAERTPDALALVFGDEALTYAELHRRSDALARVLAARGVDPDSRVGICAERSLEMVVGLLGILKAGGAYLPLDPAHPAERLAYMLADAEARVLLVQDRLRGRVPHFAGEVVALDGPESIAPADAALSHSRTFALSHSPSPDHLAYVIYTSGTTGQPKGTEVPHRAIPGFFRGVAYARFDRRTVTLQHSSTSWDALTLELWPALLSGGTCVLYPGTAAEPALLGEQVRRHGVNTLWLTSTYFNLIVDTHPEVLAGVEQVMTGGETVSAAHARRALELYPGLRLVNGYGPSETTVFASCFVVPAGLDAPTLPVGRPIGDRRVHVLDRQLGAVPIGVSGEVCVGGPAVARGYLGRPELTAEKFVPDPFGREPGARLYRSGDRARWRADGTLEFVGRTDFQVKVRGFRVEPGEVEAVLAAHPAVREAVVVVKEGAGGARLVGYVTAAEGEPCAPAPLRAWLGERLPAYMVPGSLLVLERLPLTANGKVDRRALPAPEHAADAERYVAPRTPAEEVLAGIWAEVLGVERVGTGDGFFEMGGHSLLATRVVSRIREVLAVELPLRALFEAPTVAGLAQRVEALRRAEQPALPPVVPVERAGAVPLSFAQERLWFLDRLQPGSAFYNVPAALRLSGGLDARALGRALGEIVRRHEALRTTFAEAEGSPVQIVAPFGGFELPVEDLAGLGESEREATAKRRAAEDAARPFDLRRGPLFRAALLRLDVEEYVLLLCMHHVVSDEWSMGVLFGELAALYAAYREGGESPLPELAVQYADYAVWQREQLQGEVLERQIGYWKERLAGAPELLELPADHPRPAVQTFRGAAEPVALQGELLERLEALSRREGVTLYMTLLAAFQALLSRYSGSEDVVVGSPIAGRTRRETEGLIGFFVNTLVLRSDLSGDPSFREVLRRVRETTLGAYEHQEVPFERLVAELRPERSLSHSPLVQVIFALQNAGGAAGTLPGLQLQPVETELESAKFDLILGVAATPQGLQGEFSYATDLFERATIARMLGHLERVLEQVADDAEVRLGALELLGEAERAQVLEAWNRTEAEYPADRCVHQLFEAQAARTPDAPAVVFGAETLSYAELAARTGRLAHHLRRLGVGPEARVGICLERSPEMVVAVLAVLRAGGAYVPLDPAFPAERLGLMAADSGIAVLLTQGKLRGLMPDFAGEVVVLDSPADLASGDGALPHSPSPDNLAYVIYTSGSTGAPKGVLVTHGGLANYLAWFDRTVLGPEGFALPLVSRLGFDAHVRQLFPPLLRGEPVWVLPEETVSDPDALLDVLSAHGRVSFGGVPSLWSATLERVRSGAGARPEGLKAVLLGGEALPRELAERTFAVFPEVAVWNHYGPTEATVNTTVARVRPGEPVTLGRPVGNVRVYLLDAHGSPVPVGVPGEAHVGGAGVARGYLARPDATAEKFVPDPFAGEPGARMYRSGDRLRWRADGQLEFVGRVDEQVKVRGFRIEPGEIQAVLRRQGGVDDCAVVVREDRPGEKRLVAYVVPEAGTEPSAAELREHLRGSLPDYMVPAAFVMLDRLPLTPNGKLDRGALP